MKIFQSHGMYITSMKHKKGLQEYFSQYCKLLHLSAHTFVRGLKQFTLSSHAHSQGTKFIRMRMRVHYQLVCHIVSMDLASDQATPIIHKRPNFLRHNVHADS